MQLSVGDICIMKKKHPCGQNRFMLMRVGADVRIRCLGCQREVWMTRGDFTKAVRSIEPTVPAKGTGPVVQ